MKWSRGSVPVQGQLAGKQGWFSWPLLLLGVLGLLTSLYFFYQAYQQSESEFAVQQTLLQQHRLSGDIRKRWTQGQGIDQLQRPLETFLKTHRELLVRSHAVDGDQNEVLNVVSERMIDALAGLRDAIPDRSGNPPALVDAEAALSANTASESSGVFGKATTLIETSATLRALLARDQAPALQVETAGHLYQLAVSVADRLGVHTGDPASPDVGAAQGPWLVFEQILKRMEAMVGTGEVASENHTVLINDVRARQMELNRLFGAIRRGESFDQAPAEINSQSDESDTPGVLATLDTRHSQLDDTLAAMQSSFTSQRGNRTDWFNWGLVSGLLSTALLTLLSLYALSRSRVAEHRSVNNESQREAAILKLLDEIESLAEGDLNTKATVSEGVTGAIADSVNYAVSELRRLVGTVSTSSERVSVAVEETGATAQQLANAAVVQSREISRSSAYMKAMSDTMSQLSLRSTEAVGIARESVALAGQGAESVQQTADTAHQVSNHSAQATRMMRRLVDSASQITRSVRLIDEAAEKTRLLAMNTTIRSRTGSTDADTKARQDLADVADQVQTLANRLGQSAAEIETLVTVVQQDVGVALENMQQIESSMVELTGRAGSADTNLKQIHGISERLEQVVKTIDTRARKQSAVVEKLAGNMNVINEVTRQSSHGLRLSASALEDLRLMSTELRDSVAEFSLPERDIAAIASRTDSIRSHEHVGAGSQTLAVNHTMLALGDDTLDRETRAFDDNDPELQLTTQSGENASIDAAVHTDAVMRNDQDLTRDHTLTDAQLTQLDELIADGDEMTMASDDVLVDMDSDKTQLLAPMQDRLARSGTTHTKKESLGTDRDDTVLLDADLLDTDLRDTEATQLIDTLPADASGASLDNDDDATIVDYDSDLSTIEKLHREKLDLGHD